MSARSCPAAAPPGAGPGAGRVILRQVPGLDPVPGLPVVLVAVAAVLALAVLFFVRGPVPWPGSLRCSWPCCRSSSAWSCCRSPPVRIAAGAVVPFGVAVPVALVVLVAGKEQGDRKTLGPGDCAWRRACCPPGRADLGPGCFTWCPPGAGRGIRRQLPGLDPAARLLVVLVVGVAVAVLPVSFLARGPVPWSGSLRCSWPCCRPSSAWSCWLPPVRIAAGLPVVVVALVVLVVGKEQGGR